MTKNAPSTDALGGSVSPYLAAHAAGPIPWRRWGVAAFAEARDLDRPLFASIGYHSCERCRALRLGSFGDTAVARLLAERFVPVMVDRVCRPDVDAVYLDYVTATSGSGGWPLAVFLTPEGWPFFGETYLPRDASEDVADLIGVLETVADSWRDDRAGVRQAAAAGEGFLRDQAAPRPRGDIDLTVVERAAEYVMREADETNGGFGTVPKFPLSTVTGFLLALAHSLGDGEARYHAMRSLEGRIRGGGYDHAGGGPFRYAAGADWTAPSPEKTLYDSALLLSDLARAHGVDPREEWAAAARGTAAFLERDLAASGGLFHAAVATGAATPEPDTNLVVSWNALAARGLLEAGASFDDPHLTRSGLSTLDALLPLAARGDGVPHVLDDPSMEDVRLLEDAAALSAACLTAAEIAGRDDLLPTAAALHDEALARFGSQDTLYMTDDKTDLPVRAREERDEPTPSGAATSAENAVRLWRLSGDSARLEEARSLLEQWWAIADFSPLFAGRALDAAVGLLDATGGLR
ncbi:MAG: DUF255 domain-containing protein [Coriobacteriia bacterium]